MGYVVLITILSVDCVGLEAAVDKVYLQHSLHNRGFGDTILERLFRMIADHAINGFALEIHKKKLSQSNFSMYWDVVYFSAIT